MMQDEAKRNPVKTDRKRPFDGIVNRLEMDAQELRRTARRVADIVAALSGPKTTVSSDKAAPSDPANSVQERLVDVATDIENIMSDINEGLCAIEDL